MQAHELRKRYIGYFVEHDHHHLPSASLVPNDPTLLFTAAGMVQFKDIFWGRVAPNFPRVTTYQKCFRTTDIENVGRTAYHHTFFEMLGNFSFGDYFKDEAIKYAWGFLTEELGIPSDRLWVSVFEEDNEAFAIWNDEIGIPRERIARLGKEHNWWGPVG
ncbi:MAG TPA: alanine--tRNA ligase, partial [Candidatus Acetothermia bacterium]|nr:alanine--tRNA ligase [Candidatus Acetothermia bacterium]